MFFIDKIVVEFNNGIVIVDEGYFIFIIIFYCDFIIIEFGCDLVIGIVKFCMFYYVIVDESVYYGKIMRNKRDLYLMSLFSFCSELEMKWFFFKF